MSTVLLSDRLAKCRCLQWLVVSLIPLSVWLLIYLSEMRFIPSGVIRVKRAEFMPAATSAYPPSNAAWQAVSFPDRWRLHDVPVKRYGWYRSSIDLQQVPEKSWRLYFPDQKYNIAVYLNGRLLGDGGPFEPLMARNYRVPLSFTVAPEILRIGDNTVEVLLGSIYEGFGELGAFYFGPEALVAPLYHRHYAFAQIGLFIITLLLLCVLAYIAVLAVASPRDPIYRWFALVSMIWVLHNGIKLPTKNFFGNEMYPGYLLMITIMWFSIFMAVYINRFAKIVALRLERGMGAAGVLVSLILLLLSYFDVVAYIAAGRVLSFALTLMVGLYIINSVVKINMLNPSMETKILAASVLAVWSTGVRDSFFMAGLIYGEQYYLHYSAPAFVFAFCGIVLRRNIVSFNRAEELNRVLESKVQEKQRELERQYAKLRKFEEEQLLFAERQRIMRDLHDGIGGQLVSTLAMLNGPGGEAQDIRRHLQMAIDDLRIIVDSMHAEGEPFTVQLAAFRWRMEPRLKNAGLCFDWQIGDLSALDINASTGLQLMRIVQEAMTNAIKHAAASMLSVHAVVVKLDDGRRIFRLALADNGCGYDQAKRCHTGKGLSNMRRRAASIGAELQMYSGPKGTCVTVSLDLASASLNEAGK